MKCSHSSIKPAFLPVMLWLERNVSIINTGAFMYVFHCTNRINPVHLVTSERPQITADGMSNCKFLQLGNKTVKSLNDAILHSTEIVNLAHYLKTVSSVSLHVIKHEIQLLCVVFWFLTDPKLSEFHLYTNTNTTKPGCTILHCIPIGIFFISSMWAKGYIKQEVIRGQCILKRCLACLWQVKQTKWR